MTRQHRIDIARHTDQIVRDGRYLAPSGAEVTIAGSVADAVRSTVLYLPEDATHHRPAHVDLPSRVEVTGESTLAAARRLVAAAPDPVACLNFASARHPGGGYRSGAQAQEESLARSSALVACLERTEEYYRFHNTHRDARYSDRVIYSPAVPVFRNDDGTLLEQPYHVAFLTAAAPNVSAMNDQQHLAEVPAILRRRATAVLSVAHRHGHRRLVLGAWGCGVFGNDPSTVARVFAELLSQAGPFGGQFSHVVFAVLDHDPSSARRAAFHAAFPARGPVP
jgi:uncharacterized protein (TIGR02452 family)